MFYFLIDLGNAIPLKKIFKEIAFIKPRFLEALQSITCYHGMFCLSLQAGALWTNVRN
jgi:hypothetical protein